MKGVSDYAVVYDITDNGERQRVAKTLKDFGFRAQKSVFELRLNKTAKKRLMGRLEKLEIKTGFIKIYRLEHTWRGEVIGKGPEKNIDSGNVFIV
jgi:CRISPR-associated protein Cas2